MSQTDPATQGPTRNASPIQDPPRTKKACDLCRSRKVKAGGPYSLVLSLSDATKCRILDDGDQCAGCRDLEVPCTHARPRRRRGPPNRHVQDIATSELSEARPISVSPKHACPTSCVPDGCTVNQILGSLGSRHQILGLLDDWFRFVHPLAPVLHRQHFLQRFDALSAKHDRVFAALVLSVCAVTISTLRRKCFEHYPALAFETCIDIIEKRGLLCGQTITLDWCIAWYNIASAIEVADGAGTFRSYRAIREAMTGVNWLLGYVGDEQTTSDKEHLKRLFWLLYMWQVGAEIQGQAHLTFLPFSKNLDHLRPKDVTDRQLHPDLASTATTPHWPEDDIHFIQGLNSLIDVFLTWEQSKVHLAHQPPEEILRHAVNRIQATLDNLHPDLRWTGGLTRYPQPAWGHRAQMVNILITALSLKSNFLQHLGSLLPGLSQYDIVCDALEILEHLPQPLFEVNGHSLVVKIRDIGAAYLSELNEESRGGTEDEERRSKVHQVLKALENLDFRPRMDVDM